MGYTPPYLHVLKSGIYNRVYAPSSTSGDAVEIYANTTDVIPLLRMTGLGVIEYQCGIGSIIRYTDGTGTYIIDLSLSGTDAVLESKTNNNNLYLKTNGSGVVKFGTHTGSGDVACNGSISIKDAGGTTRKLMTTA